MRQKRIFLISGIACEYFGSHECDSQVTVIGGKGWAGEEEGNGMRVAPVPLPRILVHCTIGAIGAMCALLRGRHFCTVPQMLLTIPANFNRTKKYAIFEKIITTRYRAKKTTTKTFNFHAQIVFILNLKKSASKMFSCNKKKNILKNATFRFTNI